MRVSKLTQFHEQILARVGRGESLASIAEWLKKKHSVAVSKQALSKVVASHRKERAETSKHIVREHIEKTLPADLDELAKLRQKNRALLKKAQAKAHRELTPASVMMVRDLTSAVERAAEAEAKAMGLHEPDSALANTLNDILKSQL